jgi:hypothetical protein
MSWQVRKGLSTLARRLDHGLGRLGGRRQVLVDVRTPMNLAVLRPVWRQLSADPRVTVRFTAEHLEAVGRALEAEGLQEALVIRRRAAWMRFDLALTADLWSSASLRRCRRVMTFFHGVAGKYDLDQPGRLAAAGLDRYDRVAFINADRMERYIAAAAIRREQAALIGFPKLDGLLRGDWHPEVVRESLGLPPDLETVLYAPTFSVASSLHLAGEAIIEALLDSGRSVIVKLHDRSLGVDPDRTAGIDWMARLSRFERHPRYALARGADVTPLFAAADVLVTDHSTVGFEFALLDRPIVVYDAPDLKRVARISDDKWALLRSMADVVATPADLRRAMDRALADPGRLADARRAARALFAHAGHATERALSEVYGLLELPPPDLVAAPARAGTAASVRRDPPLEVHG